MVDARRMVEGAPQGRREQATFLHSGSARLCEKCMAPTKLRPSAAHGREGAQGIARTR